MAAAKKTKTTTCPACNGGGKVIHKLKGGTIPAGACPRNLQERMAVVGTAPAVSCPECSGGVKVVKKSATTIDDTGQQ